MVWRWIILLRARGAAVTTKSATWIYLVSSFVGGFLPAGVGADAARAYTLSQRTARGSDAVASVAVDRLFGLLSIVMMGVVGAVIAGRQIDGTPPFLLPATALVVFSGSVAMLWADRVLTALLPAGIRASGIGRRLTRLADAVSQYRGHRRCPRRRRATLAHRAGAAHCPGVPLGPGDRHRSAVHLLSALHADRTHRAAAADFDLRHRRATGHHRVAPRAGWRSRTSGARALDADRAVRDRGKPPGAWLYLRAARAGGRPDGSSA